MNTKDWRFYGRKDIRKKLLDRLDHDTPTNRRLFSTYWIRGRRGVGKTELIREVRSKIPSSIPFVYYQMVEAGEGPYPLDAMNNNLLLAAQEGGLPNISQLLPPTKPEGDHFNHFKNILTTLWQQGGVVILDEFHHATKTGIAGALKDIIDIAVGSWGDWGKKYPGKLVLMGSHQQKIDDMFKATEPLHGLVDEGMTLGPWSLRTTLTVAEEHDILAEPGKFLTLWTAYGGMPRNWRRYCMDDSHAHLHGISDRNEWRQEFLKIEHQILENGYRERFDDRAFVELQPEHRNLFLWIGERHPRGVQLREIPGEYGNNPAKIELLRFMKDRVGLMDRNMPFGIEEQSRWRITDNNTLFQVGVFPGIWKVATRERTTLARGVDYREADRKMTTLEGPALEQMGAQYLKELPPAKFQTASSAWHPKIVGDVDVLAVGEENGDRTIWMGNAKRNPEAHDPWKMKELYQEFLARLGEKETRCTYLLISPSFDKLDSHKLKTFRNTDFAMVDIHDMARNLGVGPNPDTDPDHLLGNELDTDNSEEDTKPDSPVNPQSEMKP